MKGLSLVTSYRFFRVRQKGMRAATGGLLQGMYSKQHMPYITQRILNSVAVNGLVWKGGSAMHRRRTPSPPSPLRAKAGWLGRAG